MKVLILPDGCGWVVDRNCQALVAALPDIHFTVKTYTHGMIPRRPPIAFQPLYEPVGDGLLLLAQTHDIIHLFNWDVRWLYKDLLKLTTPLLISIRSHRYSPKVLDFLQRPRTYFHVINKDLLNDFPSATYIPNGIFDYFSTTGFTVGYAGHPHHTSREYDGYYLIEQACTELGVLFKPALGNIKPEDMPDYYRSINLYVCASQAEGFSTGVMECLAMNIPVVSTDCGEARQYVSTIVERSVEGIKAGIRKYYTQDVVKEYRWANLAPKYWELYGQIYRLHN